MKTTLVNESHDETGVEWSVSVDGFNTPNSSQTIAVRDKENAFKLKKLIDDLKEKLSYCIQHLEYRIEDKPEDFNSESEVQLRFIIDDIKTLYL